MRALRATLLIGQEDRELNDKRAMEITLTQTKMAHGKAGRRKGEKTMASPTAERTSNTQKTVFDLGKFDDVKLVKTVTLGAPVTSIQEALARLENDSDALLAVINAGLDEKTVKAARESNDGWNVEDEEGNLTAYDGKFASEEQQGKKIDAVVLSMAKVLGYDKSLSAEKKRELKEQARAFIRSNPAIIESMQKA